MASSTEHVEQAEKVRRSEVCPVCSEKAPEGKVHKMHYGAICCCSCQAFFLRAHRRKASKKFKCTGVGNCLVERKEKFLCQKCRLDRCLEIGMDPKLIMSDEEKRHYFKNFFKKKDEEEKQKLERLIKETAILNARSRNHPRPILPKPTTAGNPSLGAPSTSAAAAASLLTAETTNAGTEATEAVPPPVQIILPPGASCFTLSDANPTAPNIQFIMTSSEAQEIDFSQLINSTVIQTAANTSPVYPVDLELEHLKQQLKKIAPVSTRGLENPEGGFIETEAFPEAGADPIDFPDVSPDVIESDRVRPPEAPVAADVDEGIEEIPALVNTFKVPTVLDLFSLSMGKLSQESNAAKDIILMHQNLMPPSVFVVINQLSNITAMMTDFAFSEPNFSGLNKHDQALLLKNNIPLYLQYILARYFGSKSSLEQLSWILVTNSLEESVNSHLLTLRDFSADESFSKAWMSFVLFCDYVELVDNFFPLPQIFNGLIANMLLFYSDEQLRSELNDPVTVENLFVDAKHLLEEEVSQVLLRGFNFHSFIFTLSRMKGIFEAMEFSQDELGRDAKIPRFLSTKFTDTEERWLMQRFERLQVQFRSVTPPEELIPQVIMLLSNKRPTIRNLSSTVVAILSERSRRILKIHPEFRKLTDSQQDELLRKNSKNAAMLGVIRINTLSVAKEQLGTLFGVIDFTDKSWEENFSNVVDIDGLIRCRLDEPHINDGKLDEPSRLLMQQLFDDFAVLCRDQQIFQLLLLLTLLDADDMPNHAAYSGIFEARDTYLKLLQRKLFSKSSSYMDFVKFKSTIKKIKLVSNLIDLLIMKESHAV